MPEEEKRKGPGDIPVDIDTSGPDVDVDIETKEEAVDTAPETTEQETKEVKEEASKKEEDSKLEDYSKGVQARIAKLTRKMREAERREAAAVEYANALEKKRKLDLERFNKVDSEYNTKFAESIKSEMDAVQKQLATAIESQDAAAQVQANKRIAELAFEDAKLKQRASNVKQDEEPVKLSDGGNLPKQTPQQMPQADPMAEEWASKNSWFGTDRAMTFTAFEIHKDLVEKEGYDPKSQEYYAEIDKRIKVDFPHKFGNTDNQATNRAVQSVASANRSSKPGRKQVRLTSSQVAIAKKLGVPLEEYAKQLKLTEEHNMTEQKTSRAAVTRSKTERPKVYKPPSSLDAPPAPDGFRHRWIRAESVGFQDSKNIYGRLREGYELVRADEYKDSDYPTVTEGKYAGVIGVGGLLLARIPIELAEARMAYQRTQTEGQDESIENDLLKDQDKRMPIKIDRNSKHTFGGTKK